MSIFGWSLPAGCTTLPGEEEESKFFLKCSKCGCFLKHKYESSEQKTIVLHCIGLNKDDEYMRYEGECGQNTLHEPHDYIYDFYTEYTHVCNNKKCSHVNKISNY